MKLLKRRSATGNLMNPVKSSVKFITRGGTRVWGSITRKRKSSRCEAVSEPLQKVLHLSLIEIPSTAETPELFSTSLHSSISVTKSTDQKHYTCLSPIEVYKIKSEQNQLKLKLTPSKPSRRTSLNSSSNHDKLSKLTYEDFKTTARSSTPMRRSQSLILYTSNNIDEIKTETSSVVDFDILNRHNINNDEDELLDSEKANCLNLDGNEAMIQKVLKKDIASGSQFQPEERDDDNLVIVESDKASIENILGACCDKRKDKECDISTNNISKFKFSQGATVFDRSTLGDICDTQNKTIPFRYKDPREELIKEKFIVNIYESPIRKKFLSSSPICKDKGKVASSSREKPSPADVTTNKVTFFEGETSIITQFEKRDKINDSFASSFCSEDSISVLLTDHEEESDEVFIGSINDTENFDILRRRRNQECSTIRGVSKALSMLRKNRKPMVGALLQAERVLLLSTERCRLYTKIMMDSKYKTEPLRTTASATISKITIKLRSDIGQIFSNTYFMCLVYSDNKILATKYVHSLGKEGRQYIRFNDDLVFQGLAQNFNIYVKVYCFQSEYPGEKRVGICKVFPKKTIAHPVERYYYDDLLTNTREKEDCFLPAFKQCAEFEITEANFADTNVYNYFPDSILDDYASIKKSLSNLKMNIEMKGLLNFGQRYGKNELIIWNIKYVALEEYELKIYNSPSDDEPLVKIDLRNLASELVAHRCHLKNCFQLDIVYDEDPDFDYAFKFPYFLRANSASEFKLWSGKLNYVINRLRQWRMLPFLYRQINY